MTVTESAGLQGLRAQLISGLEELGVKTSAGQRDQLLGYVHLLDKWNKVYNLTAIREPDRMVPMHILDSLSIVPHLGDVRSIVDIGSGAGLPGIPLAICLPQVKVTMIDTVAKKTAFIRQAIGELALNNAEAITSRVEAYRPDNTFDRVVSRALSELKDFIECAKHLCTPGGAMLAMKGVYPHDELERLPAGFAATAVLPLTVPKLAGSRHLVIIQPREAVQS